MGGSVSPNFIPASVKNPKVMMVGVVPPPVHGQSIATQALFDGDLSPIQKITVPIQSSKTLVSVGKFSFSKAFGLISLVLKTWAKWGQERPSVLYYTAGSGAWVPFIRDLVFLSLCRPLFKRTLIHYHSGNLLEFVEQSKIRSKLGRHIYGRGAWTLRLSAHCPAPTYPENRIFDVMNGLDAPSPMPPHKPSGRFRILFLGNLFEEKGVIDLIDAVHQIASSHPLEIQLSLVGNWPADESREKIEKRISDLPSNVFCPAPQPAFSEEKWRLLANHDIFVFPSYYRSENLPLVIIEAMAASLPVVATDWRGIKSLVVPGETGLLVPPRDVSGLASAIRSLAESPTTRTSMAEAGRLKYERSHTLERHLDTVRNIFLEALQETTNFDSKNHHTIQSF